jgi:hypothetical protein
MIIPPQNWYNLIKNDIVLCLFIFYSVYLPYYCCLGLELPRSDVEILMLFDIVFMVDRFLDLLEGYINENNKLEPSITKVVFKNLSLSFFIELFITFIPLFFKTFFFKKSWNALLFFAIKSPRFLRLFEMED